MEVNYDVTMEEVKRASSRMSEEAKMVQKFLEGKQKNMCFEYETEDEAKSKAGVVAGIVKRTNKDGEKISYGKRANKIYIMRV